MTLRRNVIANYLGQGWRALMNLAFIPLYVKLLGIEAYGLVGFYALLQAWMMLLDLGLRPTLGREMARFTAGARSLASTRNLLWSVEVLTALLAAAVAGTVMLASRWLSTRWLSDATISPQVVSKALNLMGLIVGLRLLETLYVSALVGLQKQVRENLLAVVFATARGFGTYLVLLYWSPTVHAFFTFQLIVSSVAVVSYAIALRASLHRAPTAPVFSILELGSVWRFAAGMTAITLLSLLLTQVDKVILSKILPLAEFGYYTFAGVASSALYVLLGPLTSAFNPVFTELATTSQEPALARAYHRGAQLVSVVVGSAAVVLVAFSTDILAVWTRDPQLTERVSLLLSVLATGTLLNTLMNMPYQLQLAHGWTRLPLVVNLIAVCILLPAILLIVPHFGAVGAAWTWVALNAGYLLFNITVMHKRILKREMHAWWTRDVVSPLGAAIGVALLIKLLTPTPVHPAIQSLRLVIAAGAVLLASALCANAVREPLLAIIQNRLFGHRRT